jgi:predicted RNA-binding Zn-ribbon protein involved in translation (DUF1610 family)
MKNEEEPTMKQKTLLAYLSIPDIEHTIQYICPKCEKQMVGFYNKMQGEFNYWYCASCGWKGIKVVAELKKRPDCIFWKVGMCFHEKGSKIFRMPPICPFDEETENNCNERLE